MATYIVRKNHVISMVRGDYVKLPFDIPEEYDDNYKIYFALMFPNKPFEDSILIKEYDSNSEGSIEVELLSEETELLMPGTYYYTIKLEDDNNQVHTLIPNTKFFIVD